VTRLAKKASYLAKLCKKVTMLVRRDEMRASKAMQNRVLGMENIEVLWNTDTVEVLGQEGVEAYSGTQQQDQRRT
jgi:thioredoxin reductase (NADPH)